MQDLKPEAVRETAKEEGVVRVAIGIAHEGMTGSEAYCNRLSWFKHLGHLEERGKILKESPRFEFYQITVGRVLTPFAREEIANRAENAGMDYLMMIDDDMIIEQNDIFERLYADQVDIVAPLAFTRGYPHKPVLYSCVEGYDAITKKDYFINTTVMNYPREKLVRCDAVGFGAVLMKMSAVKAVPKPRFMSTCGTGEDIYFCYQAGKQGFKVFMDTRVKLGHIGHPTVITEGYVDIVRKRDDMQIEKHYGEFTKYENDTKSEDAVLVLGDR